VIDYRGGIGGEQGVRVSNMGKTGVRSPAIGSFNRSLVLESVRLHPGASRVEVAQRTGLTAAAVSNIVRSLIGDGLIVETGRGISTGGKPRTTLRVNAAARYSIGVHFDPRAIFGVLVDLDGTIVGRRTVRLRSARPLPDDVLDRAAALCRSFMAEIDTDRLAGIGIACPGPIDAARGTVIRAPNLPDWGNTPIRDMLESRLQFPVTLENDANAAAVGEKWIGAAQHVGSFLYVFIGAGVGGAIFLDHQLYRGRTANAGAVGHMTIRENGRSCGCGSRGCLEAYCSQQAVLADAAGLPAGELAELGLSLRPDTIGRDHQRLVQAAATGHSGAGTVLARSAKHLATGISSLVNILDIDAVFLGGHAVAEQFLQPVRQVVADRPVARSLQRVQVVVSSHGELAGAIGAASMVLHDLYAPRNPLVVTDQLPSG
jgi:predicted NBD/HSP70 family sugar kinase